MRRLTFLLPTVISSVGCTVGPNYKRPATAVPANFRAPDPLPPAQADSIADVKWFEVFKDEKLRDLARWIHNHTAGAVALAESQLRIGGAGVAVV